MTTLVEGNSLARYDSERNRCEWIEIAAEKLIPTMAEDTVREAATLDHRRCKVW